jgi:hypothetical protein
VHDISFSELILSLSDRWLLFLLMKLMLFLIPSTIKRSVVAVYLYFFKKWKTNRNQITWLHYHEWDVGWMLYWILGPEFAHGCLLYVILAHLFDSLFICSSSACWQVTASLTSCCWQAHPCRITWRNCFICLISCAGRNSMIWQPSKMNLLIFQKKIRLRSFMKCWVLTCCDAWRLMCLRYVGVITYSCVIVMLNL